MHRIVHTEFYSSNPKKTAECLSQLFGWNIKAEDMGGIEYIVWSYPEEKTGGGGIMRGPAPSTGPTMMEYVEVENIANSVAKATGMGAKVIVPEQAIGKDGEHGHFSLVLLPGDCPIGLWAKNASK